MFHGCGRKSDKIWQNTQKHFQGFTKVKEYIKGVETHKCNSKKKNYCIKKTRVTITVVSKSLLML